MTDHRSRLFLEEVDSSSGLLTRTFVLGPSSSSQHETVRVDELPQQELRVHDADKGARDRFRSSQGNVYVRDLVRIWTEYILAYLKMLFLPTGYPHSVTEDYTWYQIYDSIQAFASSIAGLLSSRAVLQSFKIGTTADDSELKVDPSTSVSVATAATLVSILQNTLANVTSIIFASRAAPRISRDVKFYRFLADVVNDAAFVLDLLAPMLPDSFSIGFRSAFPSPWILPFAPRTIALCASSMLRAICGVAGGSSKAVLSTHFARNNPEAVGDLQAKDSSQETVINLLGIWVGGYLVSKVEGFTATWCWMLGLLTLHLLANYLAVKSIRLKSLNSKRAGLVTPELCEVILSTTRVNGASLAIPKYLNVEAVGQMESVLGLRASWLWLCSVSKYWKPKANQIRVGVSLQEFLLVTGIRLRATADVWTMSDVEHLLAMFENEAYVLWMDMDGSTVVVTLKRHAGPRDQFKALLHAHMVQKRHLSKTIKDIGNRRTAILDEISYCLRSINGTWPTLCSEMQALGWDLSLTDVDEARGIRVDIKT